MPNRQHEKAPIVLFEGGPILTLDPKRPRVDALIVRGERIAALGSAAEVRRLAGRDARRVSLGGRCLFPAFVDHHVHLLNVGFSLVNDQRGGDLFLDLAGSDSQTRIADRVAQRAAELDPEDWVLGTGWSQNGWEIPAMPRHDLLTEAAPEHPALLARVDVHSAWVNRAALSAGGIDANSVDPPGGLVVRDPDGTPSGMLVDRACEPVLARSPRPTDDVVRAAFRLAADGIAARGFTRVYEAGFLEFPGLLSLKSNQERYLELLLEEDAAHPLPIDVHLMIMAPSDLADKVVRNRERYRRLSPRIGVTHLKMHADGALGSRGAWLSDPYDDDPCCSGLCRTSPEELRRWVDRALEAGLDVATHAIGDRANETVLDVYEAALAARPGTDPRRLRVEHFSYASDEDRRRAARLGVLLAVQPGFVEPDEHGHVMEDLRLGLERAKNAYAFGELHALGARMAGSTDDYTFVPNAMRQFFAAATRRSPLPGSQASWQPDQCLSRHESLRLLTRWYRDGGGEPERGVLTEGAPASFVVLSADPLTVPEDEILSIQVQGTYRLGQRTYDDGSIKEPKRRRVHRRRPRPRKVPIGRKR